MYYFLCENVLIVSIYIIHKNNIKHFGLEVLVLYGILGYFELQQVIMNNF